LPRGCGVSYFKDVNALMFWEADAITGDAGSAKGVLTSKNYSFAYATNIFHDKLNIIHGSFIKEILLNVVIQYFFN
jgi:hypothetical protein